MAWDDEQFGGAIPPARRPLIRDPQFVGGVDPTPVENAQELAAAGLVVPPRSPLPSTDDYGIIDSTETSLGRVAGYLSPKEMVIFDNEQTWGAGSFDSGVVDKIRLQSAALWPAYFNQQGVPDKAPKFIERGMNLGQGQQPLVAPRVHSFQWSPPEFADSNGEDPTAPFGKLFQAFDLLINIGELERIYGTQFGLPPGSIEEWSNGNENPDLNLGNFNKFRAALVELYGLGAADDVFVPLREFADHSTEVSLLMTKDEVDSSGLLEGASVGLVRPVYNYMLFDYEQALESVIKPAGYTHVIPNIYVIASEITNPETIIRRDDFSSYVSERKEETFRDFITVGNLIRGVRPRRTGRDQAFSLSEKDYFCTWTGAINKLAPLEKLSQSDYYAAAERSFMDAGLNFTSIIIPPEQLSFIKTANDTKEIYPMFNEIQFQTDKNKEFANLFVGNHLSTLIMREGMLADRLPYNTFTRSFSNAQFGNVGDLRWTTTNEVLSPVELKTTDVAEYWEDFDSDGELLSEEQELLDDPFAVMLGSNEGFFSSRIDDQLGLGPDQALQQRRLLKENFRKNLTKICQNSLRSYRQMVAGVLARSETVFYKIEKRLNGQLVQEFYIPNNAPKGPTGDLDIFKYIDTQVMYGKSATSSDTNIYDYKIYAGQLVIGGNYSRFALRDGASIVDAPLSELNPLGISPDDLGHYLGGVQEDRGDVAVFDAAPEQQGAPLPGMERETIAPRAEMRRFLSPEEFIILNRQVEDYLDSIDFSPSREDREEGRDVHLAESEETRVRTSVWQAELDSYRRRNPDAVPYSPPVGDEREPWSATPPADPGDPQEQGIVDSFAPQDREMLSPLDIELVHLDSAGNVDLNGPLYARVKCMTNITPSLKLIQVPIFDAPDVALFDKPPAFPDINIIPYRSVDNQALINMSEQVSTHRKQTPVFFNDEEKRDFANIQIGQYLNDLIEIDPLKSAVGEAQIVFGNDDPPASYEVYRIENPPGSYEDFRGNLHHVTALVNQDGRPIASTAALKDSLQPNRKYYYTFRIKDIHGHVSNPTDVFQVELVNDGSSIYILVDIYDFPEEPPSLTKDMGRYLKIAPSLAQSLVNMPRSGLVDGTGTPAPSARGKVVHLGIPDMGVWGRKYKFRLTSNKTGRKLDINIDFKVNQIPEDDAQINPDGTCALDLPPTAELRHPLPVSEIVGEPAGPQPLLVPVTPSPGGRNQQTRFGRAPISQSPIDGAPRRSPAAPIRDAAPPAVAPRAPSSNVRQRVRSSVDVPVNPRPRGRGYGDDS